MEDILPKAPAIHRARPLVKGILRRSLAAILAVDWRVGLLDGWENYYHGLDALMANNMVCSTFNHMDKKNQCLQFYCNRYNNELWEAGRRSR